MRNPLSRWFDWLQAGNPTGPVERYPDLTERGETCIPGVFVIGDLTGIPLLRLAAESGHRLVETLQADRAFQARRARRADDVVDLLVAGAGPAGVAAAASARDAGLTCAIVESAVPFSTIVNFPKGKPIYAEPEDMVQRAPLRIDTGVKEGLLESLEAQVEQAGLDIETGVRIDHLAREGDVVVATDAEGGTRRALAVALAIGKSGDPRRLGVPGEDLPHVSSRLFDPAAHSGEDIVIVGCGDSASEAAIALANQGNRIVLSYRKTELTRPKEGNVRDMRALEAAGLLTLRLGTTVRRITADHVVLDGSDGEEEVPASAVYVMIGRRMPTSFLRRSGIRIEGELSRAAKLLFVLSILFANVLYFGKKLGSSPLSGEPASSWGEVVGALVSWETWAGMARAVGSWLGGEWTLTGWKELFTPIVATLSFMAVVPVVVVLLVVARRTIHLAGTTAWQRFKWGYFAVGFAFFCLVWFGSAWFGLRLLGRSPSFWYGVLYCVTMTVFGLRRMHVRPTPYIRAQTWTLLAVQWVFLWLLPEIVIPWAGQAGVLGAADGFWRTQVFPGDSWWRAYGFVLAWPLFIWNLFTSQPTAFWLVTSVVQTFVALPLAIRYFGKGVYCGWICSCGGLAETLGDEYRTKAPHGPRAKRWENAGQIVLLVAFVMTALKLLGPWLPAGAAFADVVGKAYEIVVDVVFAGVLGLGVYFFLSGRVWCRFLCPLAALMHVYAKFTRYRIFSRKKRCISCNECTKACHMGIDVMSYAVRGRPMDDVECVRCSACVVSCPMDVLAFGRLDSEGRMVPPKLHATRFEPVDWAAARGEVQTGHRATTDEAFVLDPVKKVPGPSAR